MDESIEPIHRSLSTKKGPHPSRDAALSFKRPKKQVSRTSTIPSFVESSLGLHILSGAGATATLTSGPLWWSVASVRGSRSSWPGSEAPTARACPWADAASRLLTPEPESTRSNPPSNKVTCEPGVRQADAPDSGGDRSTVLKATH